MKTCLLVLLLLPAVSLSADWVELGRTAEARVLLDRDSVELANGEGRAWLKFLYHKKQPGQTVTQGKPFDSSTNLYHIVCSSRKYQVLELVMFYRNDTVGNFHGHFDPDNFAEARPQMGAAFLIERLCPAPGRDPA